ncbi:MAG TPA: hypothetical protein VFT29_18175 [Gemmatimonadaceae bacterium]|nr:hypothetical protein [Gemmatimonadaceae bacterium]
MTRILVGAAACLLVLGGCKVNPEVRTTPDDNAALIFGYYDMSESPYELGCVRITQDERAGVAYRQSCMTTLKNGVFFLENAPPMKYHVPFFYAGGKLHMLSSDKADVFAVSARSFYFLGAYKYKVVDRNLGDVLKLTPEKYGLNRVRSPDETAVLKMLLENVQSPRWKQRIRARLAQK